MKWKRLTAALLIVAMLCPSIASAIGVGDSMAEVQSETGITCTHVHDESCGYAEPAPCSHIHDEACGYSETTPCTHVHDETCGYAEGAPCTHEHTADCMAEQPEKEQPEEDDTLPWTDLTPAEPVEDTVAWSELTPAENSAVVFADPVGESAIPLEPGELETGAYILEDDVKGNVEIPEGEHVVIDLNGHTLTGDGDDSVITNYGTLTITDNSGTGEGAITGGTGKVVSDQEDVTIGGGIYSEGILTLLNGTIRGNTASSGGGVLNAGVFRMEGGRITGNRAESHGGGISSAADSEMTFLFHGGRIDHNDAWSGGGIYVVGDDMFSMKAPAKIYSNTLHKDNLNVTRGNGTDLYSGSYQTPDGQDHEAYLEAAAPDTWGIIGMESWFVDTASMHYPESIVLVPDGKTPVMGAVGKANAVTFDPQGGLWEDGTTADRDVLLWVDEREKGNTKYFSLDDGENAVPEDPQKPGYTFQGWFTDEGGNGDALDTSEKVKKDITYYADWEKNESVQYTLTYQSNGGSYIPAEIYNDGTEVTLKAEPEREGYEFVGWCADEMLTQPIETVTMDADKTVYAAWKLAGLPAQYVAVTFDANGGAWTGNETEQKVTILRGAAFPKTAFPSAPYQSGYKFMGWYTDPKNGEEFAPYTIIEESITVYAQWKQQYQLDYVTNGGSPTPQSKQYDAGTIVTLATGISKPGHTFKGWYIDPDFDGSPVTQVTMNADVTVYAKWEENPVPIEMVQVTYHFKNGVAPDGVIPPGPHDVEKGTTYMAQRYSIDELPEGWGFDGWYTNTYFDDFYRFTSGTVEEDLDLYGVWFKANTVTFDPNGGNWDGSTERQQRRVEVGEALLPYLADSAASNRMPATPQREGHTFLGWNTRADGTGEWFAEGIQVNDNMTVYAQWEAGTWVNVRYEWVEPIYDDLLCPIDVKLPRAVKLERGTIYTAAALPQTAELYWTLDGWYEDEDLTRLYTPRALTEDLTLYGKWTYKFSFPVTYRIPGTEYQQTHIKDEGDVYNQRFRLDECSAGPHDAFSNYDDDDAFDAYLADKQFIGWKDTATGTVYPDNADFEVPFPFAEEGYTFDAVFETKPANSYVLTYCYETVEDEILYHEVHTAGEEVTLRGGIEYSGMTFLGWSERSSDPILQPGSTYTMPERDVILYGRWKTMDSDLDLVFETYGGTPVPEVYTVSSEDLTAMVEDEVPYYFLDAEGNAMTFPDPALEGFRFAGWLANMPEAYASIGGMIGEELQSAIDENYREIKEIRDKIASGNYAFDELDELKRDLVYLRCSMGSMAIEDAYNPELLGFYRDLLPEDGQYADQKIHEEQLVNRFDEDPYKESILEQIYTFSRGYQNLPAVTMLPMEAIYVDENGDLVFPTEVIYDSNNGSGETFTREYIETATVALADNPFTNNGKQFLGWNTEADGTGTTYQPGDGFTVPVGGTTLYAQWKEHVMTIKPEDQTIYTGGKTLALEDDPYFPQPIYLVQGEDGQFDKVLGDDVKFLENGNPCEELPFTVKYYDENGIEITDDRRYGDFTARIVPLTADAAITTADGATVQFADGTLRIRYVSNYDEANENKILHNVGTYTAENKDELRQQIENAGKMAALVSEDTTFYLNGREKYPYPEEYESQIALLVDELLPSGPDEDNQANIDAMIARAKMQGFELDAETSLFRYFDLVDAYDANVWVSSSKGCDVFVPYPEGTNSDDEFRVLYFDGMHREYGMDGQADLETQIENSIVLDFDVKKAEKGLWFHSTKKDSAPCVLTWKKNDVPDTPDTAKVTFRVVNGTWADGSRDEKTVTVTLTDGKGTLNAGQVPTGMKPDSGYKGGAWDVTPNTSENAVTGDVTYTYTFTKKSTGGGAHHPEAKDDKDEEPMLNTEDHYAYIVGYAEDGTVRPNANISRAEVATIFFRLLTDDARDEYWSTTNSFPDVASGSWYNNAVSTMVNAGIIRGYEDGTFRPEAPITRAEFAAIASRFMTENPDVSADMFTDIAGHWARESINDAAAAEWISGYPDGTFCPDQPITRAEAVTLVNNVLGRCPDADHLLDDMTIWPDNPESAWYYEAIQEATNSHEYEMQDDYEDWTDLLDNRDWAALEKDWENAHRDGGEVM